MKQIPKWAIVLGICLILAVLLPVLFIGRKDPANRQEPDSTTPVISDTTPETVPETLALPTELPAETLPAVIEETKPEETESAQEPTLASGQNAPSATRPSTSNPIPPAPTEPAPTQPPVSYLSLPFVIAGSDLAVTRYDSFDGIYLEDGSDRAVSGVAALVVENRGSQGIEYAVISLTLDSGTILKFEITTLPAEASIIVQEASAQAWQDAKLKSCTVQSALVDNFPMSREQVQVTEHSNGILSVTNLTGNTIPAVRVFYKFCMTDVNGYVGGITYTAKVTDLAPGATQNIDASHYIPGFSTVVMVRTYDSAE